MPLRSAWKWWPKGIENHPQAVELERLGCSLRQGYLFSKPAAASVAAALIEPFLVHAPARIGDEARAAHLVWYLERVLGLATAPTIIYPRLADYDDQFVLRLAPRL